LPDDGPRDGFGFIRPVQWWLKEVLSGHLALEDAPASIQSWARFPIFEGAKEIVLMENREQRAAELQKIPAKIRPHVEAEVKRLWVMRRDL